MKHYHTALKSKNNLNANFNELPDCFLFSKSGNTTMVLDVSKGKLSLEFEGISFLYAEIPWPVGYKVFIERAGQGESTYQEFLTGLNNIIANANVPTIVVGSESAGKFLKGYSQTMTISLLSSKGCIAYIYNTKIPQFDSATEILEYMAQHHENFGNITCGFGHSAEPFLKRGKTVVLSDINPKCISYIKDNILS